MHPNPLNSKWRVIGSIMLILMSISAAFVVFLLQTNQRHLEQLITEKKAAVQTIGNAMPHLHINPYKQRIKRMIESSTNINQQSNLLESFASQDREQLLRFSLPRYQLLKDENPSFSTFTWILPDFQVFLRAHNPELFGDNISSKRPDIVAAHERQGQVSGYGYSGKEFLYAIIEPIFLNNELIGLLQFGIKHDLLLETIKNELNVPVGLAVDTEHFTFVANPDFPHLTSDTHALQFTEPFSIETTPGSFNHDDKIGKISLDNRPHLLINVLDLPDFRGEPQGHIYVALDISAELASQRFILSCVLTLIAILLLTSYFILNFSYSRLILTITTLSNRLQTHNLKLEQRVTEQTQALQHKIEELQFTEQKLETVINSMEDFLYLKDGDNRWLLANAYTRRMFQLDTINYQGKTNEELAALLDNHQKLLIEGVKTDRLAWELGTPQRHERTFTAIDGSQLTIDFTKTPLFDPDGHRQALVISGRNITDLKKSAMEFKLAKEGWEKTFNAIPDIITIQDPQMRIVLANQTAAQIFEIDPQDMTGKACYELFRGSPEPCPGCPAQSTIQEIRNHSEIIHHQKLGKTFQVLSAPIVDQDKQLQYLVHFARDITKQKQLEKDLLQAHKMEAMGTLASGIAHDFNNILTAIIGFSQLAKLEIPPDNGAQESIDQILLAGNRATSLVKQILAFSRKSDNSVTGLTEPHLIVQEAIGMLRASLPQTIDISTAIDEDCGSIMAEPDKIHQIVVNLCTNAFQAMKDEKGTLTVSVQRQDVQVSEIVGEPEVSPGMFVVITVSDTGHGMNKETMERIFDPYFTTKEMEKGTGLGLAVIHGIIASYHGFIRVSSNPEGGATFQVFLPAAVTTTMKSADQPPVMPSTQGHERILFVDDEHDLAKLYDQNLTRMGYQVTPVTNSAHALELFQANPEQFDLIITDQTMPGLTGMELAQKILAIRGDTPIILFSGYSSQVTEETALKSGIKKYLLKPLEIDALHQAIQEIVN